MVVYGASHTVLYDDKHITTSINNTWKNIIHQDVVYILHGIYTAGAGLDQILVWI